MATAVAIAGRATISTNVNSDKLNQFLTTGRIRKTGILPALLLSGLTVIKVLNDFVPSRTKVKDIMETRLVTISPESDVFDAKRMMRDYNIRRLPVMRDGDFLGLATMKDILKHQKSPLAISLLQLGVRGRFLSVLKNTSRALARRFLTLEPEPLQF